MYLIIYDIKENTTRNKIARLLISEGYERIQLSVFCGLFNPVKNKVWKTINNLFLEDTTNSIICIKISIENFYNLKSIGNFNKDLDFLTGKKKTIII